MELRYKLVEATREISNSSWKEFARCQLNLPDSVIDHVAFNYNGKILEQKSQMLQRWLERTEVIAEYLYILVEKFFINKLRQRFFGNLDSQPNTKETHGSSLCQGMSIPEIHCGSHQIKLLQIFQKVTSEIPITDWLEFVRCYLDLPDYVIDDIQYDHHGDISEQKYQMLKQWHERKGAKVIAEYLHSLVENFQKSRRCFSGNLDSQPIAEEIHRPRPSSYQEMSISEICLHHKSHRIKLQQIFPKVTCEISNTDWLEFVRCNLDLPEGVIDDIKYDYHGNIREQKYHMLKRWYDIKGYKTTAVYLCNLVENFLIKKLKQRFFCNLGSQQITELTDFEPSLKSQFEAKKSGSLGSISQPSSDDVLRNAMDTPKQEKSVAPTVRPFWARVEALHGSFAAGRDIIYSNIVNFNLYPSFIVVVVLILVILSLWRDKSQ